MAQGSSLALDILRLDLEGDGLADVAGRIVRVPLVIPGERVEVRLIGRDRAELQRVVSPSPHRVAAPCRHFGPCGGCTWQHIAYPEQLRLKQQLVERLVRESLGARAPKVLATLATPTDGSRGTGLQPRVSAPWHYRNKTSFVFGPGDHGQPLIMGHYRRASRTIVPVVECPVHPEAGNRVAFAMRDALERARIPGASADAAQGIARHIVVRVAETDDSWLATLVVTENVKPLRRATETFLEVGESPDWQTARSLNREIAKSPNREIAQSPNRRHSPWGLYLNVHDRPGPFLFGHETRHLAGARDLREEVAGVSYVLSPTSFFQTNVRAARVLVAEVLAALADRQFARILDLYAGVGLFALPLAKDGRAVTAIEENREAMAAAEAAARANRIPDRLLRAVAGRVEDVLPGLTSKRQHVPSGFSRRRIRLKPDSTRANDLWDAVVLDPPREGCPPAVLDWLFRKVRPPRLVYVSCNPQALARDLRGAVTAGYRIARVQPIDMFPHTAHVETVVVLDRPTRG